MSFRECRIRASLTQEVVAAKLGVDQTAVSNWERGKNYPIATMLPRIAELYGCTIEDLLKQDAFDE